MKACDPTPMAKQSRDIAHRRPLGNINLLFTEDVALVERFALCVAGRILFDLGFSIYAPEWPISEKFCREKSFCRENKRVAAYLDDWISFTSIPSQSCSHQPAEADLCLTDWRLCYSKMVDNGLSVVIVKAGESETNFTLLAASGLLDIFGEASREPLRLPGLQAAMSTGCTAALAAVASIYARHHGGSASATVVDALEVSQWVNWKQPASIVATGTAETRGETGSDWKVFASRDGHVALVYLDRDWPKVKDLLGPALDNPLFANARERLGNSAALDEVFASWFAERSSVEVQHLFQERGIPLGAVNPPAALKKDPQFAAREFICDDGKGSLRPRIPLTLSFGGKSTSQRRPAPTPGQPLAGIRVADLGIITAGAATSSILADLGADIVKVEGPGHIDPFRHWAGQPMDGDWWNRSFFCQATNRGKSSLCIDLKDQNGRAVFLRLLEQCDVLVENFSRGVLERLQLGWNDLQKTVPHVVLTSVTSQGETGPQKDYTSFGSTLEATSGFAFLAGYPDGPPLITGRGLNYADQLAAIFGAIGAITGLLHRDFEGQAVHVDVAQREVAAFCIGEEIIRALRNGKQARVGNSDQLFEFQSCLLAADRRWIALSLPDHDAVVRVQAMIGAAAADGALANWVRGQSGSQAVELLRAIGCPAAVVKTAAEMVNETCRGALIRDANGGWAKGRLFAADGHEPLPPMPAPRLGEHNASILKEVVGLKESEFMDLCRRGIVADRPRSRT